MSSGSIVVPGHVADQMEKESLTEELSTEMDSPIQKAYVAPADAKVLDPTKLDKTLVEQMPDPTGWRIMVLPYRGKKISAGGIYIPDKTLDEQQLQTVVGYVLKVGPLAYDNKSKFPKGPWCKVGDWVIFTRYTGSRFRIEGGEVRILDDDEIIATIGDPDDILSY